MQTYNTVLTLKDLLNEYMYIFCDTGCDRLLTSAQARTAIEGQDNLKRMIIQSKNRIQIIAASGINSVNAIDIIRNTRVDKETRISGLHAGSSVHIGKSILASLFSLVIILL
jgi:copper homeostasis protein CutC